MGFHPSNWRILHSSFFTLHLIYSFSSYSTNTFIFFTSGVMASMLWRYRVRLSKVRSTSKRYSH